MKAEDTQTDIFGCCEPEPFEELPFDIDSKVNKVHHKAEKDEEHETGIKCLFHLIGKQ